ncbi:ABC transporter permease subunit [Desulfitobacterium sp. THU1]|uniref:ABC transporter permease n=1 Tax=Desulfitobacterium sp. THU1 TaxID=3138072 RepID=UPI00311FC865
MKNLKTLRAIINLMILMVIVVPFLVLVVWSFSQGWPTNALFPKEWGLRGWSYLFSPESKMLSSIATSTLISLTVTVLAILLSIPAGKALGVYEFKGKKVVEIIVLAPLIIPTITVGMGIQIVFIRYGLTDTLLGVILVHLPIVLPYGIRIFASSYKAMGIKWEEQAQVLKAKPWQRFWYATLPFLYPGIISAGVLMFNVSFSQYFLTYLIGGGKILTLPILLFPFVNSGDRVIASGLGLVIVAVSVAFMVIVEKIISSPEQETNFYYL